MAFFICSLMARFFCMKGTQQYCPERMRGPYKRRLKFSGMFLIKIVFLGLNFAKVTLFCCFSFLLKSFQIIYFGGLFRVFQDMGYWPILFGDIGIFVILILRYGIFTYYFWDMGYWVKSLWLRKMLLLLGIEASQTPYHYLCIFSPLNSF